jgi:hypothetical protein
MFRQDGILLWHPFGTLSKNYCRLRYPFAKNVTLTQQHKPTTIMICVTRIYTIYLNINYYEYE